MFYVLCPCCDSRIEVPDSAIGPDRTDPWNVIVCDLCDSAFDYDEDDIIEDDETAIA